MLLRVASSRSASRAAFRAVQRQTEVSRGLRSPSFGPRPFFEAALATRAVRPRFRTFASATRPALGATPDGPVRPLNDKDPVDPQGAADAMPSPSASTPLGDGSAAADASDAASTAITAASEGADLSWVPYPPTEPAIKLLQLVHENFGLPWWAAIAATTVCMRTLMVPVAISAMKNGAKLAAVQPEMKRLQERMQSAQTEEAKLAYTNELRGFMVKHNVNPLKSLAPIIIQMPVFMTFFFALRRMAEEFPSLESGGVAWFTDLTIADATYGLPILSASTFLITIELGGEAGEHQAQQQEKMKNVMRVLAVAMVPLTMSFPGAVFCYWCTSNSFSCVQTAMFKIPGVKAALGIPGVPLKPLTSDATNSLPQEGMPARISMRQMDIHRSKVKNLRRRQHEGVAGGSGGRIAERNKTSRQW
eukprot:g4472.t1